MDTTLATSRAEILRRAAEELAVPLDSDQQSKLLRYLDLLSKWNAVYNLTALREPSRMLTHHLVDCLAVVPVINRLGPRTVLDLGSGAGLPGIVLAIALPRLAVTLVDAVQKKTAFLMQVKTELGLSVTVVHGRVEALTSIGTYDCIISRAFSSLAEMVSIGAPRLAAGGNFVAMKGAPSATELASLPTDWVIRDAVHLTVPGLDAARSAIVVAREAPGLS